jgi:methylthioribose-1-phosphate isomerase
MSNSLPMPQTLAWRGDPQGHLDLLDQTRLPSCEKVLEIQDLSALIEAIQMLRIRGAPAIGVAAGYGAVLAIRESRDLADLASNLRALEEARPTAVNLAWAVDRIRKRITELGSQCTVEDLKAPILREAIAIHEEDKVLCDAMGRHGADLIQDGWRILTHCNTGSLATGGSGTALAAIKTAYEQGKRIHVYADETRPLLQGARLTLYELARAEIPATLLQDSAAPGLILGGAVDAVFVGADRIAGNGDTANKVGTLPLALAAKHAGIPFYIVAPTTTFDFQIATGSEIPIEERESAEILDELGPNRVPKGTTARNPAFDITPGSLITGIVTEEGVLHAPYSSSIKLLHTHGR